MISLANSKRLITAERKAELIGPPANVAVMVDGGDLVLRGTRRTHA